MLILITNDDGIDAPALLPLKKALDNVADTLVFAPDRNWSASGHPKTIHKPIRANSITLPDGSSAFVSTGPPPDCVALAMLGVSERQPDMVVSGINDGANLGYDVFYSGTVAAAIEAAIEGLPALAVSRDRTDEFTALASARELDNSSPVPKREIDYEPLTAFCAELAKKVMEHGLPSGTFLNVTLPSVPWNEVKGIEWTRLGSQRTYHNNLVINKDPRGRPYYWIGVLPPTGMAEHGTDMWALENNLISITPINLDLTDYRLTEELKSWGLENLPTFF